MSPPLPIAHRPLAFVALVFTLSLLFLVFGAITRLELLPGLPIAVLMVLAPLVAAAIPIHREEGPAGVAALLKRAIVGPRTLQMVPHPSGA